MMIDKPVQIIGGGLAGTETAWRLAQAGMRAEILEMRPVISTPAHQTGLLAELVCSNSLRAEAPTSAVGLLKEEMTGLDSLVMAAALKHRIPAGKALAVDREAFAQEITKRVAEHPLITLTRIQVRTLPEPGSQPLVVAAGPLAGEGVTEALVQLTGEKNLHFYDAIAPIVEADSINHEIAFWASRYADPEEEADYLNCPLNEEEYKAFYRALMEADKVPLRSFEKVKYFEGCLPIEVMAERGEKTLSFGPLKPVGLVDPRTGERPHAVVQLRKEDRHGRYLNLVGFQTKLTRPAQEKVFRTIPGMEEAVFARLGSIHRNTFVCGPEVLAPDMSLRSRPDVLLAGQISGVEGYVESSASGILAGEFIRQRIMGTPFTPPPPETALGAILGHCTLAPVKRFQPSNINFSLFPALEKRLPKKERPGAYMERARAAFKAWSALPG